MKLSTHRKGIQRRGLQKLIDDLPSGLVMIEIGCYRGESTEMFMLSGKVERLYAIDPWRHKHPVEKAFETQIKLHRNKIRKLKGIIDDFVSQLPAVDFIYIDGNHSYESVRNDIEKSLTKLKTRGIMSGHDYNRKLERLKGVPKAVDEILGLPDKVYDDTSWVHWHVKR